MNDTNNNFINQLNRRDNAIGSMDLFVFIASGVSVSAVIAVLILKRKSIKAYFASVERKKEWAIKRNQFVEDMNRAVNPITGYQMIAYSIKGRQKEKATMSYTIPLEDLNCKHKWKRYLNNELNQFIDTLRIHQFKVLEIKDCNGNSRTVRI